MRNFVVLATNKTPYLVTSSVLCPSFITYNVTNDTFDVKIITCIE